MKKVLGYVVVVLVVLGLMVCSTLLAANSDNKKWNNGICIECGIGNYEYVEAIGHYKHTTYLYKCSNCNHKVEFEFLK